MLPRQRLRAEANEPSLASYMNGFFLQFKGQICNNFVRGTMKSKHMPTARIECSVAYSFYTYGEHASPTISVTHTRYDQDPADIPKKAMSSVQLQTPVYVICVRT